tara:strand:- start:5290 stop:6123 length:834 start_codon:yes stop_codon:yes gene_type:complete
METLSHQIVRTFVSALLLVSLIIPVQASAAFQPQTRAELVAYLYGQLAILQEILTLRLADEIGEPQPGRTTSDDSEIDIDTLSARDVETDEAELQLRVDFDDTQRAVVWFEYGESKYDMDERTNKYSLTKTRDDNDIIKITIRRLDEDQKYYFQAVGEDSDGNISYGSIRSFVTEEDNGSSSSGDDFDISVDDYTIDPGDEIEVEWEVPDDEAGSQNWIGLFEYGDSNTSYVEWTYINNDDNGTVYFTIDDEGDYDVRLFLDNSYDDEVRSGRIEVD